MTTVRAPGTIQQDERRIAVIAMRSEAWIDKVENVTTGDHVRKGQPLFRVYSPAVAGIAAEYVAALAPRGRALGTGSSILCPSSAHVRRGDLLADG